MDAYDACIREVDQHFTEGRVQQGLQLAIDACRHRGPEPEPWNLRDARTDMLTKVIMYKIHGGAGDEVLDAAEGGLLDRRLFGWLYADAEVKLFPTTAGAGYDRGFDDDTPMPLARYIRGVKERPSSTKHVRWLRQADKAVSMESSTRFLMINDPYRVGARVYVHGLRQRPELNGEKATVTRRMGQRCGVVFDKDLAGRSVQPANLTPVVPTSQKPGLGPVVNEVRAVAQHTLISFNGIFVAVPFVYFSWG